MALQETISLRRNERKLGAVMQVLIDETDDEGIVARSKADAPEIDGNVFVPMPVNPAHRPKVGDFVNVLIDDCDEHDLWGQLQQE